MKRAGHPLNVFKRRHSGEARISVFVLRDSSDEATTFPLIAPPIPAPYSSRAMRAPSITCRRCSIFRVRPVIGSPGSRDTPAQCKSPEPFGIARRNGCVSAHALPRARWLVPLLCEHLHIVVRVGDRVANSQHRFTPSTASSASDGSSNIAGIIDAPAGRCSSSISVTVPRLRRSNR